MIQRDRVVECDRPSAKGRCRIGRCQELLEIGGVPLVSDREKPTRNEALKYYRKVVGMHGLNVHQYEEVLRIEQLPLLDGYEATRRIKADPTTRAIPIIVVTSYALSGDETKAREAGCDAYVPKPYSPRELLAKIKEYLPTT